MHVCLCVCACVRTHMCVLLQSQGYYVLVKECLFQLLEILEQTAFCHLCSGDSASCEAMCLIHMHTILSASLRTKSSCTGHGVWPRWFGVIYPWGGGGAPHPMVPMRAEGSTPAFLGACISSKALTVPPLGVSSPLCLCFQIMAKWWI